MGPHPTGLSHGLTSRQSREGDPGGTGACAGFCTPKQHQGGDPDPIQAGDTVVALSPSWWSCPHPRGPRSPSHAAPPARPLRHSRGKRSDHIFVGFAPFCGPRPLSHPRRWGGLRGHLHRDPWRGGHHPAHVPKGHGLGSPKDRGIPGQEGGGPVLPRDWTGISRDNQTLPGAEPTRPGRC